MKVKVIGSNRAEVWIKDGVVLVSYQTPIAALYKGKLYRSSCAYSQTTSRHLNRWLRDREGRVMEMDPEWFQALLDGGDCARDE